MQAFYSELTASREGCALDLALETRRPDLVDLLLTWGADPHQFDRAKLFDTYESSLFERFYALGVDLTVGHAYSERPFQLTSQ